MSGRQLLNYAARKGVQCYQIELEGLSEDLRLARNGYSELKEGFITEKAKFGLSVHEAAFQAELECKARVAEARKAGIKEVVEWVNAHRGLWNHWVEWSQQVKEWEKENG